MDWTAVVLELAKNNGVLVILAVLLVCLLGLPQFIFIFIVLQFKEVLNKLSNSIDRMSDRMDHLGVEMGQTNERIDRLVMQLDQSEHGG